MEPIEPKPMDISPPPLMETPPLIATPIESNDLEIPDSYDDEAPICKPGMNELDFKALDKLFDDTFNYDARGSANEESGYLTEFKPKYIMSEKSKEKKKEILKTFYETFSGKPYDGEEELTKFSQIKLTDFSSSDLCTVPLDLTQKSIDSGSVQMKLMDYAAFVQNMLYCLLYTSDAADE